MLPGAQTESRLQEWMFPWTIPDEMVVEKDPGTPAAESRNEDAALEEPADERPVAYRAWCVAHAEELRGGECHAHTVEHLAGGSSGP
ncbi:MAG: hypothetical protein V2A79_17180 [Planctomycetota bacterium]